MLETEDYGGFSIKRIEHQLIGELNWNIDMTREEFDDLLCTLLEREYGDGWKYVKEYIDHWNTAQDLVGCWQCWGWNVNAGWEMRYNTGYLRDRFDSHVELFETALNCANSKAQVDAINRLYASSLYRGCFSSYFNAYLENDTERIELLSDRYDHCMNIVKSFGCDPTFLPTIGGGAYSVSYAPTLYEEAWKNWQKKFKEITGYPRPEDAPEIAPAVQ